MKVEIDLSSDSATVQWAPHSPGAGRLVRAHGRGLRLLLNATGEVVGVEVLGWSDRADDPADVQVRIHSGGPVPRAADDDPLVTALRARRTETDTSGRPVQDGTAMLSVVEAAALLGLERSWVSRELSAGRLRGRKIGREWWTTEDWIGEYRTQRSQARTS